EAVAQAHLAAVERGRRGENYLLPGISATFREVFSIIADLLGKPAPKRDLPLPFLRVLAGISAGIAGVTGQEPHLTPEAVAVMSNDPQIASTKAMQELGYRIVPLRAMIEDSYRWLKAEGLLA